MIVDVHEDIITVARPGTLLNEERGSSVSNVTLVAQRVHSSRTTLVYVSAGLL